MDSLIRRFFLASVVLLGCLTAGVVHAQEFTLALAGTQEVPPVTTAGTGTARVTVASDGALVVKVTTQGFVPTASHIHQAASGANGPVVVPFTKTGDNTFETAPGARLNEAQMDALKRGLLYINVHSAANPGGEIRAQIVSR